MENINYSIILKDCGQQKLLAVKLLCEACGFSLKESKDVVEQAPSIIKSGMSRDEAMYLKGRIEAAQSNITVEILPDEKAKEVAATVARENSGKYDKGKQGCMVLLLPFLALASAAAAIILL